MGMRKVSGAAIAHDVPIQNMRRSRVKVKRDQVGVVPIIRQLSAEFVCEGWGVEVVAVRDHEPVASHALLDGAVGHLISSNRTLRQLGGSHVAYAWVVESCKQLQRADHLARVSLEQYCLPRGVAEAQQGVQGVTQIVDRICHMPPERAHDETGAWSARLHQLAHNLAKPPSKTLLGRQCDHRTHLLAQRAQAPGHMLCVRSQHCRHECGRTTHVAHEQPVTC
mmetsp:Transcript_2168/g.3595  ORF Transcript_2168/g.3595 Transcript_2168/m.3595 type:complete len:223 (-) Transcript_2168:258-926(-)